MKNARENKNWIGRICREILSERDFSENLDVDGKAVLN
jgi:hypothetical protein